MLTVGISLQLQWGPLMRDRSKVTSSRNYYFFLFLLLLRMDVRLLTGYFRTFRYKPSGWSHIVLNYLGPNNGQGIRMFINGAEVASSTTKTSSSKSAGDGRIVIGRWYTDRDQNYASVQVDELIFFDEALKPSQALQFYNSD